MSELEEWLSYMDNAPVMDEKIKDFIEKEKKELYSSPKCGKYGSAEFKKYFSEREEILNNQYPEYRNPLKYWK